MPRQEFLRWMLYEICRVEADAAPDRQTVKLIRLVIEPWQYTYVYMYDIHKYLPLLELDSQTSWSSVRDVSGNVDTMNCPNL